jgi:hypothetical protein
MDLPTAQTLGICYGLSDVALENALDERYAAYARRAKRLVPGVY